MFINKLPVSLSNQIAAGEVVERPASVVKELLENALDARASRIILEIRDAGRTLIKVRDNGSGIVKEDLPLALAPHATSKIASQEDLEEIKTLGFRGEALASIASVSQLELTSRSANSTEAYTVRVEGLQMESSVEVAAHPQGTTVEVRELFFNTPGRRRFLKSDRTEYTHIKNVFVAAAAAYPHIAFEFYSDGKNVYKLTAVSEEKIKSRLSKLIDPLYDKEAIDLSYDEGELKLKGYLLPPPPLESSAQEQVFLVLNGRAVSDKILVHAIKEAYLEANGIACPVRCVIYIDCPYGWVDVNVHPRKLEVRFRDSRIVHDCVAGSVLQALRDGGVVRRYIQPEPRRLKVQEDLPLDDDNALSSYAKPDGSYHHLKFGDEKEQVAGQDHATAQSEPDPNDLLREQVLDAGEGQAPADAKDSSSEGGLKDWSLKDSDDAPVAQSEDHLFSEGGLPPLSRSASSSTRADGSSSYGGGPGFKAEAGRSAGSKPHSSFLDLSDDALAAFNDQETLHSSILGGTEGQETAPLAQTSPQDEILSSAVLADEEGGAAQDPPGTQKPLNAQELDHEALARQARYYEGSVEGRLKLDQAHAASQVTLGFEGVHAQILALPHPKFALVSLKNRYFLVCLSSVQHRLEDERYQEAVKDNTVEQWELAMPFAIKAESSLLRALKLHLQNVQRCGFECKVKKDSVMLFKIPSVLKGCDLAFFGYKALHLIAASPITLEDGRCPLQLSDLMAQASLKDAYTLSEAEALCSGIEDPQWFKELKRCAELDLNDLMRELLS